MSFIQLIADLLPHSEPAWAVSFNPARNLLASCSTDRTIRLYSYILPTSDGPATIQDPKPVFSLVKVIETDHKRTIRSIAWSPDGKTLASGSFDSTVGVWEEVIPDESEPEGAEGVYNPAGSDNSDENDERVKKEWECVTTLEGHESECKSVAFSADGALLASCSRDKSVWVWEVQPDADFECIAVMMEHTQDVKCLAWHPHEEILASASYDSHIHLAFDDPDSDWCIFQKAHPTLPPLPLTIPPNSSQRLIEAMKLTKEDIEAESALNVPALEEEETIWSLAWSPCGRYLASGGDTGGIRIWSRNGNQPDSPLKEIVHIAAHSRSVFSLSWSPSLAAGESNENDLGLLASGGGDGKLVIWTISSSTERQITIQPLAAVRDAHGVSDINSVGWCLREDGKGRGMVGSVGDDGSIKVWRVVQD